MKKLLFSLFLIYSINSNSQVIYSDEFDAGINKLNGFDNLISSLDNNTLKITGNGNAGAWDNIRYSFHNNGINTAIDASSSPKIYIKLKAENSPTVRVDFVDANGYSTSLYGLTAKPTDEYQVFELNYTDRLVDGGYGGPCSSGPCNLDATNLVELAFYVNPGTGGYSGNINIEWISIGESLEKEPDLNLKNAKVIGYLPDYRFSLSSQIHYEQLTHLMLCFANPDFFGNLIMTDFTQIVNDAKTLNPDIKIFLSLAGGLDHNSATAGYWKDILLYPTQRTAFIDKIVDYAKQKNLDGIDIDLEFDLVTQGYSEFVIELAGKLKTENIEITAAFPKVYYDNLTQDALEVFDFINLMAYDNAGFWSPSPAQHSSYTFAEDNINFWKTTGKISPEKLILGVPFTDIILTHTNGLLMVKW
ncbi:glycosyl hydrolase family 18 protein [Polaribacter sp. R77954]|uniref:glycosyl hydrolase family 18 protein n=1 Tax=Polaribacter sp. R77954 TaxID=3093870 RepID=UPI0037C8A6E7